MASGQTLCRFTPAQNEPPAASYATPDVRNSKLVLDFDAAADESAIFSDILPRNYAGGGLTVSLHAYHSSAITGSSRWQVSFERGNTDIDADSFAAAISAAMTANGTSGIGSTATLAFLNTEIDGLLAGEPFRIKVTRDADGTTGTDDATGDAELFAVEIKET